jgi:hypothetical protein
MPLNPGVRRTETGTVPTRPGLRGTQSGTESTESDCLPAESGTADGIVRVARRRCPSFDVLASEASRTRRWAREPAVSAQGNGVHALASGASQRAEQRQRQSRLCTARFLAVRRFGQLRRDGLDARLALADQDVADVERAVVQVPFVVVGLLQAERLPCEQRAHVQRCPCDADAPVGACSPCVEAISLFGRPRRAEGSPRRLVDGCGRLLPKSLMRPLVVVVASKVVEGSVAARRASVQGASSSDP